MSNYPNMSYCMVENTLSALGQVIEAMHEEGPQFLRELNRTEQRAFKELFSMCEDFLSAAEELEDECERETDSPTKPRSGQTLIRTAN